MTTTNHIRNNVLAGCFACMLSGVFAQDGARMAIEAFEAGNYLESIERYGRLVNLRTPYPDYFVKLGQSYLRTNVDPKLALDHLLEAENMGDLEPEVYLDIAEAYMHHLQYDMALEYVEKYEAEAKPKKKELDNVSRLKNHCLIAQDLVMAPLAVSFNNLGPGINSPYPDQLPFVDSNDEILVFSSRRKNRPGAKTEFDGYYSSDIFLAKRETGDWDNLAPLSEQINTEFDEQAVGMSASGDSLFYYLDHIDRFGDVYLTTKQMGGFGEGSALEKTINTGFMESSVSVSRDGKAIAFSSNRKGGSGEADIWMMRKSPGGQWGEPQNAGTNVNTPWNEDFPSFSPDGRTLYFASNGHPGMGGYDLYFTTWDDQSSTWTPPQNLGYPLNTAGNEMNISFTGAGNQAYTSAFRQGGIGDLDIYKLTYTKKPGADPALFLIRLSDSDSKTISDKVEIQVKNEFDELIGRYYPNSLTNRHLIALYPGKYFVSVDAAGFKPYNEVLVVNASHGRQEQNVKLIKLQK